MSDPRKGKPSASGIERLAACPGSWNLESKLPPEPESEDASSGTRIHAALAGDGGTWKLTESECDTFLACKRLEVETRVTIFGNSASEAVHREHRLWLGDAFSGQYDFLAVSGTKALLLDYKTGRGEVASADGNLQLRSLAVLVAQHNPELTEIMVGIIQPWASPQVSLCKYTSAALEMATEELKSILAHSLHPKAERIAGEKQCKYCRAKAHCPEARNTALVAFEAPEQSVVLLTPDELGDYLGRIALAETIIDALKTEAKSRLEKGEKVTGWKLKPGSKNSTITDPQSLFNRFAAKGGTVEQFMRAINVAKGKFEIVLKEATQIKGKDLDREVDSMLSGITETKTSAPSLARD